MADAETITARDLLRGFLELRSLSPRFDDWTEDALCDNPPRLFRLRRLAAMFRAFGVAWDPPSFAAGGFIQPEHPRYAALMSRLTERMRDESKRRRAARDLPEYFATLFRYRERVDGVLNFSSGMLEASGLDAYAHHAAGELNSVIRRNIALVEEPLAELISPERATFTVEQMARDHGCSDVDLSEIDAEWW